MFFQYVLAALLVAQGCLALDERITDGDEAPPHQFPHQVSIVWGMPPLLKYRHICGGSILNKDWILTAGHCIKNFPLIGKVGVQAGKHIINRREDGQQFSGIETKVVHWQYRGGAAQHDIGLLKLKTPLSLNRIVAPIQLPEAGKVHSGMTVLSGWGSISKRFWPKFPTVLQTASVPIVSNQKCFEALREYPGDPKLYDTQVCTGPVHTTVAACTGDHGGPLIQYDSNTAVPELVGVVAWGIYPCGSGAPSVYTRVSSYIDWINDKISH